LVAGAELVYVAGLGERVQVAVDGRQADPVAAGAELDVQVLGGDRPVASAEDLQYRAGVAGESSYLAGRGRRWRHGGHVSRVGSLIAIDNGYR
jgi:hypothetical protein